MSKSYGVYRPYPHRSATWPARIQKQPYKVPISAEEEFVRGIWAYHYRHSLRKGTGGG